MARREPKTQQGYENQLVSLAMQLTRQKLEDGTASSQLITQVLKMDSERERLEKEKIRLESELLQAKKKSYDSVDELKRLYADAMTAFKSYSGGSEEYEIDGQDVP